MVDLRYKEDQLRPLVELKEEPEILSTLAAYGSFGGRVYTCIELA
jgi:hypothetical protein